MVIAEARRRIDFRDPKTMKLVQSLHVDCRGLDHVEFTADDRYAIATCEFSGQLVKIDLVTRSAIGYVDVDTHPMASFFGRLFGRKRMRAMPQDIRSRADGELFYAADMKDDVSSSSTHSPSRWLVSSIPASALTESIQAAMARGCT